MVAVLNYLSSVVFWNLLAIVFCQEPAYKDIVYGGAWKYVTINPNKDYTDLGFVEKELRHYVSESEGLVGMHEINYLECYAMNTLIFSLSNREPLSITKQLRTTDGSLHPISIPITVGVSYHCDMTTTLEDAHYQHYLTASSLEGVDHIFILSHILFSSGYSYKHFEQSDLLHFLSDCEKQINLDNLYILSTLARRRDLNSQVCRVKLELQKIQDDKKLACRKSVYNDGNNSSSVWRTQLDVMSYNIWNFNPYMMIDVYSDRIRRLAKLVADSDPDVIGLQEVRLEASRGGRLGPSQLDHLMPHLKQYQFVYQPGQMFESSLSEGRSEEGVAILSKHPILYHDYLLLYRNTSNSADGHQRVCLHAVIDVPRIGQVHVFNTHYSLSHEAREKASEQILEFMSLYKGPAFLLGDLNATPGEKSVRMLLQNSGLVDVWSQHHGDEPGYTFNTLESKLSKRIDYILMRRLPDVDLTEVEVMNDKSRSNICSDHRAILAKLSFKSCL